MPTYSTDSIIQALTEASDLNRILDQHHLSAAQILYYLRSKRGKQQLKARRDLAKIHAQLLAHRHGPYAINKLCQLVSSDKPELRLKGALAVLAVAGITGKGDHAAKKIAELIDMRETLRTPEDGEVLSALAEVLRQRRAAEQGHDQGMKMLPATQEEPDPTPENPRQTSKTNIHTP